MKTALVLGATGLVGRSCLQQLLNDNRYGKVISIGRSPIELSHPHFEHHQIDFSQLAQFQHLFKVDQVFCCLGTTLKKAKTKKAFAAIDFDLVYETAKCAKNASVETFAVISSLGANPKSLNYYSSTKGKMEQALCALNFAKLIIVRPSLLLGERQEHRLLEKLSSDIFSLVKPLFIGPLRKIKPISVNDVALGMIKTVNIPITDSKIVIVENQDLLT